MTAFAFRRDNGSKLTLPPILINGFDDITALQLLIRFSVQSNALLNLKLRPLHYN